MIKATFDALSKTNSPKKLAAKRNKKISDIINQRNKSSKANSVEEAKSESEEG